MPKKHQLNIFDTGAVFIVKNMLKYRKDRYKIKDLV